MLELIGKMDDRGEMTLEAFIRILISVIVLAMLIGLAVAVYFIFFGDSDLQKVKIQMEKLEEIVSRVQQSGQYLSTDFFPPVDWYLVTFPDFDYPVGACRESSALACVCLCNTGDCSDEFDCRSFDFKVSVEGVHIESIKYFLPVLKLDSINELSVCKSERFLGFISIKKVGDFKEICA
jgi:hypothetical protein